MRILIVEDEAKFADHIKRALVEIGYVVDIARDGIEGKHMALEGGYDLMLLDIMLPGIDGFGVLHEVRERRGFPIILLTARDSVEDRVMGLNMGADDYVVKPVALPELLARVQALLRRGHAQDLAVLRLGDLQLDLVKHRATRSGTRLDLSAQDFKLLALFLRRQGQVQSRTIVAEQIWDMNFDCDSNVVDVAVRRLRQKIDDPFPVKLLHTVRGVGYVMETRV
ncbi:heavy metal response regulator transcription factor [Polaromonas sp.]|uniref:heavy metal response regulator transcription factor n=1 Tax=Polaromonas sp. TaxID=1869339 RepID=UPI002730A151|nr:heavy metal response regulator transcription factor [Polaromonas sp.]MDP1741978.1 heavy metal response regulator transcription factor [Polaromonas sp.]